MKTNGEPAVPSTRNNELGFDLAYIEKRFPSLHSLTAFVSLGRPSALAAIIGIQLMHAARHMPYSSLCQLSSLDRIYVHISLSVLLSHVRFWNAD